VELAAVWEMLNKSVMPAKPFAVLGDFWQPILERVREVEQGPGSATGSRVWGEANGNLVHSARTAEEAAEFLADKLSSGKSNMENRR
jgi:hypothetical protein